MTPARCLERLRAGDVALGRLDVRRTLDGVEPRLLSLLELRRRGVRVNGGVDFDRRYSLPGSDAFRDIAAALGLLVAAPRPEAIAAF
jgi:hypothetical protein